MFLNSWITGAEFGQAYSIITLGSCTSGIIGGPLAILFLSLDNFCGLRGWQWLFLVEGIPTVLLGLVFPFVVPRRPSDAKWLTPAEAKWLEQRAQDSAREKPGHSTKAPTRESSVAAVKSALTYWRVWYLGIVHLCGLCRCADRKRKHPHLPPLPRSLLPVLLIAGSVSTARLIMSVYRLPEP